jgi:uncharacterized protein
MIHPHTELRLINQEIGYGVFATKFIPQGTIVWVQDALDREMTEEAVALLPADLQERMLKYCYRNNRGYYVLCWDHNRYINHSFNSNCIMTANHLELAVRDIKSGEELTDDYGYFNIIEPFEAFDEGLERKTVFPDDLTRHHPEWDRKLEVAYRTLASVEQPLRKLIADPLWETLQRISAGTAQARSIQECFFNPV